MHKQDARSLHAQEKSGDRRHFQWQCILCAEDSQVQAACLALCVRVSITFNTWISSSRVSPCFLWSSLHRLSHA